MYDDWARHLDRRSRHLRLRPQRSAWIDKHRIYDAFDRLFARFRQSVLVVSYRSDGIPSETELVDLLRRYKPRVRVEHFGQYKYVLSTNSESKEILLIGHG